MTTRIVQLSQSPELLGTVARWIFDQWWAQKPDNRVEHLETIIEGHLVEDRIPLTLIALHDGEPAGTVSLLHKDSGVESRVETPWLAALLTLPRYRHMGIASSLVEESTIVAARMGIDTLHVITEIPGFYQRLGWKILETYFVDSPDDTILVRKPRLS